jgi:hypothetical protein
MKLFSLSFKGRAGVGMGEERTILLLKCSQSNPIPLPTSPLKGGGVDASVFKRLPLAVAPAKVGRTGFLVSSFQETTHVAIDDA